MPPENVNRLETLMHKKRGILRASEFSCVEVVSEVRPATMADVLRVHEYPYVRKIQRICERIPAWHTAPNGARDTIDGDTEVCRDSFQAALCAAGAVVEAVDRVVAGSAEKVFCAVRPQATMRDPMDPLRLLASLDPDLMASASSTTLRSARHTRDAFTATLSAALP